MKKLLVVLSILVNIYAVAEETAKMDASTHDALITKLETLLPDLTEDKAQSTTVQIRLADLYSDRARMKDFAVYEQNCPTCEKGDADRKQALTNYEIAKTSANVDQLKHVLLQLAHLYKMGGTIDKSSSTFKSILKDSRLSSIHKKAQMGIADISYGKGEYKKAVNEFQKALPTDNVEDKIYINYRLAWSQLYSENVTQSIKHIKTAVEIALDNKNDGWYTDLMEDYATLMSHSQFSKADVETFIAHSKTEDKTKNLKFLGQESERLGNKKASLLIWNEYLIAEKNKNYDKAEIQLKLAQNFFDLNDYPQTLLHLDQVVLFVKKDKCEDCDKVTSDFRTFLIAWNKKEKTEPSKELVLAYEKYLSMKKSDFEAMVWAAQVAMTQKEYIRAANFYEQAAKIAKAESLESITSSMVEAAEESKDKNVIANSLQKYLELNPNGKQKYQVMYQIAFNNFQAKKHDEAFSQFKRLALEDSFLDKKMRYQAANLSIDALTELKKDTDIRDVADKYAKAFPQDSKHFSEISRRVTINRVISLNDGELKSEMKRLIAYNIDNLKTPEQISHYKTIIVAAEKLKDLETIQETSQKLLRVKNASRNDVAFARKSLLWTYEQKQDYKNAYKTALITPLKDIAADQRHLKLGIMAELAHENPKKHYEDYLRTTKSVRSANEIRVKLIRANPKLYDSMKSKMVKTPDLFAAITLELHLQKQNWNRLTSALKVGGVKSSSYGKYMQALVNRRSFENVAANVRKHRINSSNLKASIKQRINLLTGLEKHYKQALRSGDMTLQLRTLRVIAMENKKFHGQINAMVPRGLRKQERQVYQSLLAQQSAPFQITSQHAEKNINEFSKVNEKALDELENAIDSENTLERRIALNEFMSLKPYANGTLLAYLDKRIAELQARARR